VPPGSRPVPVTRSALLPHSERTSPHYRAMPSLASEPGTDAIVAEVRAQEAVCPA
jgi:hypothetical protein